MLAKTVADVAENFQEDAFTWENERPWRNLEQLAEDGFVGVNTDSAYGGSSMTEIEAMIVIEEVGNVCPDTAQLVMNCSLVAPRIIEAFGTTAAKENYLPPVVGGEEFITIAMSEAAAGSDIRGIETTARDIGETLVVDGEKKWVGTVADASAALTCVRFPDGIGSIVVDLDSPGISATDE